MATARFLTPQALRLMWGLDPAAFLKEFEVPSVLGCFVLPLYVEMSPAARLRLLDRVPCLVLPEAHENGSARAFLAADSAIREAVPMALEAAGLLDEEAFHYLESLHPVIDRPSAHAALLAAWDACVVVNRHRGPEQVRFTALEARDSAVEAHWGGGHGAWAEGCAHHAALAMAHCASSRPQQGWDLALRCLDRMLQPPSAA
jgi:hypothetical protein